MAGEGRGEGEERIHEAVEDVRLQANLFAPEFGPLVLIK